MEAGLEALRNKGFQSGPVRYSICITHHNNVGTVRESLESILGQIDESFEVIVVDSHSDDGSAEILKEYGEKGKIRLVSKRCSRGVGRQTALENCKGAYVVSHMDMDDVYDRRLLELIARYHLKCEGKVMVAISSPGNWTQNVTIAPTSLLKEIGGWRDLQWGDDWDLWSRAAVTSKYAWTVFPMSAAHEKRKSRAGFSTKLRFRFRRYRDSMSLGRDVFRKEERVSSSQRLLKALARISLAVYPSSVRGANKNFKAADPAYFAP